MTEQASVSAAIIKDVDQIAGANGGHTIALELVLENGNRQWVCVNVEDVPRLFAKFMSAAHHCRDERKEKGGVDLLSETWRHYEVMRVATCNASAYETKDGERRVVAIFDGAADFRVPVALSPDVADKLAEGLRNMAQVARSGQIPKPPTPSSRN